MKRINSRLKQFGFITALMISVFSCKKSPPAEEVISPNTKLLTERLWYFYSAGANIPIDWDNNGQSSTILTPQMNICEKDNTYSFGKNGDGSVNEGFTKCNAADPQSYLVTWKFLANDSKIIINNVEYEIVTLNELSLVTNHPVVKNGQSFIMTVNYIHL